MPSSRLSLIQKLDLTAVSPSYLHTTTTFKDIAQMNNLISLSNYHNDFFLIPSDLSGTNISADDMDFLSTNSTFKNSLKVKISNRRKIFIFPRN